MLKSNPSIVHLYHTFIHFLTGSQSADLESVAAEASDAFKENNLNFFFQRNK